MCMASSLCCTIGIGYCPQTRALIDIDDSGKVELPETVRGQTTFPLSFMSVNARVVQCMQ